MKIKILLRLLLIAICIVIVSCSFSSDVVEFDPEGIYECKPVGVEAPIYKFDSTAESTIIWIGYGHGVEFVDLNSGENVHIYEDSNLKYDCQCIKEFVEETLDK